MSPNDQMIVDSTQPKKKISLRGFFDPAFSGQAQNAPTDPNSSYVSTVGQNQIANQDIPFDQSDQSSMQPQSYLGANQVQMPTTQDSSSVTESTSIQQNDLQQNNVQTGSSPIVNQVQNNIQPESTQNIQSNTQPENEAVATPAQDENNEKVQTSPGLEANDLGNLLDKDIVTENDLLEVAQQGYVPKIVAAVVNYALNKKASDIHIEPQSKSVRVRCRIDGVLTDSVKMQITLHPAIVSRIKILSKLKIDETRIPQDGRFNVVFKEREVDVRVSCLPTVHGEKVVMRILDKSQKVLSLEDLGMYGSAFDKTIESIKKPWGIILVTGPTGSGKSTTLNAILSRLNQPGINIITLEDPVEYETPGLNQCQVKPDIGFTFASGLRSVLRQDPNIIMVGEVRDAETASMSTHAALTGHLVLTTLHTNDTAGSLPRLINMGVEPFLITSAVDLVIAQRLVRLICPKCKEEIKIPPKLVDEIKRELDKIPQNNISDRARIPKELKFFYGRGCNECTGGYKGRIGMFEVMRMTPKIEDLAVSRRPSNEIFEASKEDGMITLKQDGILIALAGYTTIDEVLQASMSN